MFFCPYCSIGLDYVQMKERHCNNCGHDWDIYHVTPKNDLKPHSESYQCECEPEVKISGVNMIVVHNAFDGRLGVEWANEILNQ